MTVLNNGGTQTNHS